MADDSGAPLQLGFTFLELTLGVFTLHRERGTLLRSRNELGVVVLGLRFGRTLLCGLELLHHPDMAVEFVGSPARCSKRALHQVDVGGVPPAMEFTRMS